MKILVTGSREFSDFELFLQAMADLQQEFASKYLDGLDWDMTDWLIIHGDCPSGADAMADEWAAVNFVDVKRCPADWTAPCRPTCRPGHRRRRRDGTEYCPAQGNYRNQDMVDRAPNICVAFFKEGARNRGTSDCVKRAEKAGVEVWRYEEKRK